MSITFKKEKGEKGSKRGVKWLVKFPWHIRTFCVILGGGKKGKTHRRGMATIFHKVQNLLKLPLLIMYAKSPKHRLMEICYKSQSKQTFNVKKENENFISPQYHTQHPNPPKQPKAQKLLYVLKKTLAGRKETTGRCCT